MKVEMNLPDLPNGYEYTGEYRFVQKGELYHNCVANGVVEWNTSQTSTLMYCIVKEKRWRAAEGCDYYTMDSTFDVFDCSEDGHAMDDDRYQTGNYFQTKKQAEEASVKIKQLLEELHSNGSK